MNNQCRNTVAVSALTYDSPNREYDLTVKCFLLFEKSLCFGKKNLGLPEDMGAVTYRLHVGADGDCLISRVFEVSSSISGALDKFEKTAEEAFWAVTPAIQDGTETAVTVPVQAASQSSRGAAAAS